MTVFRYNAAILNDYPQLVGGVIRADNLSNPPTSDIGDTPLRELESLSAWRSAISAFGVSPTKYRSAAESLLRRLTKKGDIPSINTLVDIGNLISIRYGLPVAIFDTRQIDTPITVKYADGTESFTDLGSNEITQPEPGEVIFVDEENMAVARRWCWRQSATSASSQTTTGAIITVEAHHTGARNDIQNALDDLLTLLKMHTDGTFSTAILSAEKPEF